jgi:uncharacterized membrane protein YpjA
MHDPFFTLLMAAAIITFLAYGYWAVAVLLLLAFAIVERRRW